MCNDSHCLYRLWIYRVFRYCLTVNTIRKLKKNTRFPDKQDKLRVQALWNESPAVTLVATKTSFVGVQREPYWLGCVIHLAELLARVTVRWPDCQASQLWCWVRNGGISLNSHRLVYIYLSGCTATLRAHHRGQSQRTGSWYDLYIITWASVHYWRSSCYKISLDFCWSGRA